MLLNNSKIAFSESVPSLFVIASPLQVICAIEAIKRFRIDKYRIILLLSGDQRDSQTLKLCDDYNLNYEIKSPVSYRYVYKAFLPNCRGYKRCFIGDPRSIGQYFYAYKYSHDGATFVFLDDGDDTIFCLKGYRFKHNNFYSRTVYKFYRIAAFFRRFDIGKNFFTIYGNIVNPNYNILVNHFTFFSKLLSDNTKKGIFFIGTNHTKFCEPGNYNLDVVKNGLYSFLQSLRKEYAYENICYIPHGRDTHQFPKEFCEKLGIQFIKPDKTVELFLLENNNYPLAVYGFTSTALYNIKLLYPKTQVYNVVFNVDYSSALIDQITVISKYYKDNGILEVRI